MFRAKPSILDPIRAIFDDLGPNRHCGPGLDLQDQAGDGPLEWVRPSPKAPERSWHSSGPSFSPNRRFSTHCGPNLMFLAGKPDPLSETSTSVLSQQQTSVLSQQQTSVLSQQQTSVVSQQKTSGCFGVILDSFFTPKMLKKTHGTRSGYGPGNGTTAHCSGPPSTRRGQGLREFINKLPQIKEPSSLLWLVTIMRSEAIG